MDQEVTPAGGRDPLSSYRRDMNGNVSFNAPVGDAVKVKETNEQTWAYLRRERSSYFLERMLRKRRL